MEEWVEPGNVTRSSRRKQIPSQFQSSKWLFHVTLLIEIYWYLNRYYGNHQIIFPNYTICHEPEKQNSATHVSSHFLLQRVNERCKKLTEHRERRKESHVMEAETCLTSVDCEQTTSALIQFAPPRPCLHEYSTIRRTWSDLFNFMGSGLTAGFLAHQNWKKSA
jgi:hypothetical protein